MRRKQIEVNYLYFGVFLGILLIISAGGIFIKESLAGSRTFFFLYAAGQGIFETFVYIFLGWIIHLYLGRAATLAFIGGTFAFLIIHLIDFVMERILDLSIWEVIGPFVLDESWSNFLFLLDASGIPLSIWMLGFILLAAVPFIGIAFYAWTERIVSQKPLLLRKEWFLQAFFCIPAGLIFWEFSVSPILNPDSYTSFLKSLPWKWTFLQPQTVQYPMPTFLIPPKSEVEITERIASDMTVLAKKPNLYLFVIESFREDFIDKVTAPHLHAFKEDAEHFDLALSNANGSHPSWFSIFHSQFSYFWSHYKSKDWKMGSPPIHLLKKWGYKVRVYSSAQLKYYNMDELLFGKNLNLIDSYQPFTHAPPLSAAETDAQTIAQWKQDLAATPDLQEGQLVIFFLDSTHFNYSWPVDWQPKFIPISTDIAYFDIFQSQNKIEKIKNRYRNAVHYVDSLFGDFIKDLHDKENAVVVVTGDHGEEFFERGHLFHGSHLIHQQTNIPLYMKFGMRKEAKLPKVVSQMDIFPSIIHHLSGQQASFLEGRSIFSNDHWPYAVISRVNAGRSPYEFCIHNGEAKLIARFDNKKDIFSSSKLKIRSLWDARDRYLFDRNQGSLSQWIQMEFSPAIDRLFSSSSKTISSDTTQIDQP